MLFDLVGYGEDQYCYSRCSIPIQPFSYSAGYTGIVLICTRYEYFQGKQFTWAHSNYSVTPEYL